ncbi:Estradiol 17-beta-dehydrogenase 8 [Camponotus floridanus]|uniref:Estradiol 17-beta-dehydrogenase 8 n=1 Tax=Camponotus floridanus TaxID=104421 RepID=E1ZXD5_CAMFO|nr:Estradiol 17-beta-dehydrogenase 8 [Camponotus floridanus]
MPRCPCCLAPGTCHRRVATSSPLLPRCHSMGRPAVLDGVLAHSNQFCDPSSNTTRPRAVSTQNWQTSASEGCEEARGAPAGAASVVYGYDVPPSPLQRPARVEHIGLHINVEDRNSVETTFKDVVKHFSKPPTIIVNSAGIYRKNFLMEVDDNTFDDIININLKGTFLVMQTAVKAMIEGHATKNSSIINISSIAAINGYAEVSIHSASKAGVIAMTKSASLEFGQFGIRVNTVLPGFIDTPMAATVSAKTKEMFIKNIPLQRIGKPEEVAEVIVFLASDRRSYINGASIEISGGLN